MNLRTALLLLLCGFFYKAAQYSSADLLSLATHAQSEALLFLADPVARITVLTAVLEQTGALRWIVLAVAAKGLSWYFRKQQLSRLAKKQRLEAEQAERIESSTDKARHL